MRNDAAIRTCFSQTSSDRLAVASRACAMAIARYSAHLRIPLPPLGADRDHGLLAIFGRATPATTLPGRTFQPLLNTQTVGWHPSAYLHLAEFQRLLHVTPNGGGRMEPRPNLQGGTHGSAVDHLSITEDRDPGPRSRAGVCARRRHDFKSDPCGVDYADLK